MTLKTMLFGGAGRFPVGPPPPALTVFNLTSAPEGGWCWFQDVRVMYVSAMGAVVFGYVDDSGHIRVRTVDDTSRSVSSAVTLATTEADDHDNPAFLLRNSDSKIMAMWTTHVGNVYKSVAASANDIASLPSSTNITAEFGGRGGDNGFTYAHLFQLTGEAGTPKPIYFTFRYHNYSGFPFIAMARSLDDGENWKKLDGTDNDLSVLAEITYHKAARNGDDRIDFVACNHPDDAGSPYGYFGVYHFYYQGGNLYQSDGTLIGAVGGGARAGGSYARTDLTEVDDASGGKCWIWDIAIDGYGNPIIVYVVYEATYPSGRWHYEYARWTGSAWTRLELADAGSKFASTSNLAFGGQYAGGVVLDHSDPTITYFSSNDGTAYHEIYRAHVVGSVVSVEALTSGSAEMQIRPVPVYDSNSIKLLWNAGTYDDYFGNYSLGTRGAYA